MDSELSSRYAFIEHRQPLNDDEEIAEKILTILTLINIKCKIIIL